MYINCKVPDLTIEAVEALLKSQFPMYRYQYMRRGVSIDLRAPEYRESAKLLVSDETGRIKMFVQGGDIHLFLFGKPGNFWKNLFKGPGNGGSDKLIKQIADFLQEKYGGEIIRVGLS